jgi:hypothetical protein
MDNKLHDVVHRPDWYNRGSIEAIDAIKNSMTDIQYEGYLKGSIIKYLWRYDLKHEEKIVCLRKANWYLTKLIEFKHKDK